jgi:hypothetical protein
MFNHLKKTLKIAALEDVLQYQLGLPVRTARMLSRVAWDNPGHNGNALRAYSGDGMQSSFFLAMTTNGHTDMLAPVAAEYPRFATALENYTRLQQLPMGLAA